MDPEDQPNPTQWTRVVTMPHGGHLWQWQCGVGVLWPLAALLPTPGRSKLTRYGQGDPTTWPSTPGTPSGGLLWVAAVGTGTCHCHPTKPYRAIRHCASCVVNTTLLCSQIRYLQAWFGSRRNSGPRIADML